MKLTFKINYRTEWGESLYVYGSPEALGGNDAQKAVKMEPEGADMHVLTIDLDDKTRDFEYRYIVKHEDGRVREEWGNAPHTFRKARSARNYVLNDHWQDMPWDKPYYSSAFTDCVNRQSTEDAPVVPKTGLYIEVDAPMVDGGHCLGIVGSAKTLGAWDTDKVIPMSNAHFPTWSVNVDMAGLTPDTEFKFVIMNRATGKVTAWEGGENRRIGLNLVSRAVNTLTGLRMENPLNPWRGAGVAIPVFSIRSEQDFGVGDFYDVKLMIDWAKRTGQNVVQILPINDTTMTHTFTDSYPYNANSTFALHPMYLRLEAMGMLKDASRRKYYDEMRRKLNSLEQVDYELVTRTKIDYFKEIFAQNGAETLASESYKTFLHNNEDWLLPYAAFCVLRDEYGTADFSRWGKYAVYDKDLIASFIAENKAEIDYVCYLQYHLDKQMREVRDYAHENGVAIKGDIPIGISRTSVDAWLYPRLFNMDCQAGAPPDDFSVLGQNWGFPTYNWEEMSKDGFGWWKARFRKMSEYFDAYRIDHVLGFFRIWQIPMDAVHGLLGYFNPALPYSADELKYSYDFNLDVDLYTTPYIMDYMLGDFFGEYAEEAKQTFMYSVGYGRYKLNDNFSTQRVVVNHFDALEDNDKNRRLRDGLLGLIDQVLFIPDPVEEGKYHPRITAQFTYTYRSLNDYQRWCFDRLYNDFFYHRHNDFWYGKAMWKLPALIDATNMLVCAEDLGMIPDCVPAVMHALQILSLEIQRMPKDPKTKFGNTWSYPYYSVCTTSTHDMGGIRAWWEENRESTQQYYNEVLGEQGPAPYFAEPWICSRIIDMHLKSPSMLCILPLQDYLSIDGNLRRQNPAEEQINVPANPRHYWRYRMHLTMEQLLECTNFNNSLRQMIGESGR